MIRGYLEITMIAKNGAYIACILVCISNAIFMPIAKKGYFKNPRLNNLFFNLWKRLGSVSLRWMVWGDFL